MDNAIETLQTCLRLLDLVHRVGEMILEGKYWGALRVGLLSLSICRTLTNSAGFVSVTRRLVTSPTSLHLPNSFLRTHPLIFTIPSTVNQRRRHGIYEIVVVRRS